MSRRKPKEIERRIRVRAVRRSPMDVRRYGQAILFFAAQAEKGAETEHRRRAARGAHEKRHPKGKNA